MPRVIHDVRPDEFVVKLAEELKKTKGFEAPEWVSFVKSGVAKERVPQDEDFWYMRSASVLRQLYIQGVVGVGRLRTRYGSKLDRGVRRNKFRKASGKVIRTILQVAESVGFVEKVTKLQHGRRLTLSGKEFLDKIAKQLNSASEKNGEKILEEKKILGEKSSSKNNDLKRLEEESSSKNKQNGTKA